MNVLKFVLAGWALGIVVLLAPNARADLMHAAADADTKTLIGQPGYHHEELYDHNTWWGFPWYVEANVHSWNPNVANWAAQAEAHAKRFHFDSPWPFPDISWSQVSGRDQLRGGLNPKSAAHKASAWGSWFIIDGPPGEIAELRARIPAVNTIDPPSDGIPSQGLYADSFFDIFTDVNTLVDLPGGKSVNLMKISATLAGPSAATPGLTFTDGAWAASFFDVTDAVSPDGEPRKLAMITADILSQRIAAVPTNTPFHVDWGLSLYSREAVIDRVLPAEVVIGRAGSIGMQLELVDQSGLYNLRPVVPEPAAACLTAVAAATVALFSAANRRAHLVLRN